ncbi:hypothetical protein GCM10023201_20600 [Actinomycetospora corticicola]|uniref:Uncharacterized protein n=1 Tax=Actinomycetospora corticicola TaxID=663602 RepID=A0A7Y9J418_9PSEU|nr:hypothetical protein [Actinomycetospora corticicola]NYD34224.1 hypothetical protein [Actinomycetospora corticicola]
MATMISGHVSLDEVPETFARHATNPVDAKLLVDPSRAAPVGVAREVEVAQA